MKIEHIVPFVVNLVHDTCMETGAIIETGGGFAAKVRVIDVKRCKKSPLEC